METLNWIYYIFGAIFLVLLLIQLFFTINLYKKNKDNYYVENNGKFGWLINFFKKNKLQLFISLDVIFFLCSIVFFVLGSK